MSTNHVFEMVTLIANIYPSTIKVKETISKDAVPVEEVKDLQDDEGTSKAIIGEDGETREGLLNEYSVGEVEVSKRDVECGGSNPSSGTDGEGGNLKEAGLEEVSGGNKGGVMHVCLKHKDSQKGWWLHK